MVGRSFKYKRPVTELKKMIKIKIFLVNLIWVEKSISINRLKQKINQNKGHEEITFLKKLTLYIPFWKAETIITIKKKQKI